MLFRSYEKKTEPEEWRGPFLSVNPEKILSYAADTGRRPESAEYCCLMEEAGDYLAEQGRTLFHGAAFICGSGAYVLTAPSGTGKSTQYRNLKLLYGDRVRIINGDKPILGPGREGEVIVYPSPWNGKEDWGGKDAAPLRGMVLLEQGKENVLEDLDPGDAVLPVMQEFMYSARTRKSVSTVCRMADTILKTVPLCRFVNRGDMASSEMLFEWIRKTEGLWQ